MTVRHAEATEIPAILAEHLRRKAARAEQPLFVFSSDVAADTWAEWAVRNPADSGVQAVALEDFIAWDRFKGAYLAGDVRGKTCIPALLRKLFVRDLLRRNVQERLITRIIPCDDAQSAFAFTDWLAKILPALKLWHEKYEAFLVAEQMTAADDQDEENRDYATLFARYGTFLTENGFFEPAWLEPEFIERERTIVIFFPELLEDFGDYERVLTDADNVIAVRLAGRAERPRAYRLPDSRAELRRLMLRLRDLHQSGVPWTDIAVSVPDMETYRPYLTRECALYCIPASIRSGEPLTRHCAGQIFPQLHDCYASDFSYDSVRALLQNEYVPWKADLATLREHVIREGNRLHAICGYEEDGAKVDSWTEALSAVASDTRELAFYQNLKHDITRICEAATFNTLRTAWLVFRQRFLDSDQFTTTANNILGRCLSELSDIIDIETRYADTLGLRIGQPFVFFLNELNAKTYRPQEPVDGVSFFPYRLSAAAHFKHQFVIDASQHNLDVPYKKLGFLNAEKRRRLLGADADRGTDASTAFVRLYAKTADDGACFSCAQETFSGFAIAHNALSVLEDASPLTALDAADFFKQERRRAAGRGGAATGTPVITALQQSSFLAWAERTRNFEENKPYEASSALKKAVRTRLAEKRHSTDIVVTQSDLAKFYPCPRKWVLTSALGLREDSLDTNLMQPFDMGNVNHKVLELFMRARIGKTLPVTGTDATFGDDEETIRAEVADLVARAIHDTSMDFKDSPLVLRALDAQRDAIADGIMRFLHGLCVAPQKPAPNTINSKTSIKGFGGYTVQGAEVERHGQTEDGIALLGKIDCLLSDPESGDYAIIDYKNSSGAMPQASALTEDENGLLGDFQMPMYVTLAGKPVEAAYFYAIANAERRCALDNCKGLPKEQAADAQNPWCYETFMAQTVRLFGAYVTDFAARAAQGQFSPVNPVQKRGAFVHAEPYTVCAGCHCKGICRTTFTVGARDIPADGRNR
ncbi:MAG: PD-(D/E)XK nuclease family protein [Treponema sp.]|nr:PD-(D/E)XK nuclease family protein [Treponema sp.]